MNVDGTPIPSRSHTHPSHTQNSRVLNSSLILSIVRCSRSPHNPVYVRRLDPSVLTFSISIHRYPLTCILFISSVCHQHDPFTGSCTCGRDPDPRKCNAPIFARELTAISAPQWSPVPRVCALPQQPPEIVLHSCGKEQD